LFKTRLNSSMGFVQNNFPARDYFQFLTARNLKILYLLKSLKDSNKLISWDLKILTSRSNSPLRKRSILTLQMHSSNCVNKKKIKKKNSLLTTLMFNNLFLRKHIFKAHSLNSLKKSMKFQRKMKLYRKIWKEESFILFTNKLTKNWQS
jgi:hypothetical protein